MQSEIVDIRPSKFHVYKWSISESEIKMFTPRASCPACGVANDSVVAVQLGGNTWTHVISVNVCRTCGHVYYDNPPTEEVIDSYYRSDWIKDKYFARLDSGKDTPAIDTSVRLLADMNVTDKNLRILDVGCGGGAVLLGLKEAGFTDLNGCEMSDVAVELASRNFPGKIHNSGFAGVPVNNKFDVIFSWHAVEHMYHPREFFSWAAGALNDNGFIVIGLPNAEAEKVFSQVLYLPHLHSFTPLSLHQLGESHGFDSKSWHNCRTSDILFVFSKNPENLENFRVSEFGGWSDRSSHSIDELIGRIRAPWLETNGNRPVALTYIIVTHHDCRRTVWRSYVRLDGMSEFVLRSIYAVSKLLHSRGFRRLSIRSRLLLKLISRSGAQIKSVGYVRLKNKTSDSRVPRISFKGEALVLLK